MTKNRALHSLGVANFMKENAIEFGLDPDKMFMLGFLHDIGYELNPGDHAEAGADFLAKQGYRYSYAVRQHGNPKADFSDKVIYLLQLADMHIGHEGKYVDFNARLASIAKRYGENSRAYENAKKIVENLRNADN